MSRRRKKKEPEPNILFVQLRVDEVLTDPRWHGRSEKGSGAEIKSAEEPGQEWSLADLEASIRKHGPIHAPRIRKLPNGKWGLVAGARRLICYRNISSTKLWVFTYDERATDDFLAAATTLAENTHRRPMRHWEIANFLWSMHAARPHLTKDELAEECSMSKSLCSQLLLVRDRAAPELWSLFERHDGALPAGIRWTDFVLICRLPKHEQMPGWLKLVELQLHSPSARKGRNAKSRPYRNKVIRWINEIEPHTEFLRGVRHGLRVSLGEVPIGNCTESPKLRKSNKRAEHRAKTSAS